MAKRAHSLDLGTLIALLRPYLKAILALFLLILVDGAIRLAAPWVAGLVVNAAVVDRDASRLNEVALGLIGLFVVGGLVGFAFTYLLRATGARFLWSLRDRVFSHIVKQPPAFFGARRTGEILSRLGDDLGKMQRTLVDKGPAGIRALLMTLGTFVVLFTIDPTLTLFVLVIVPPIVAASMWYGNKLEKAGRSAQDALAQSTGDAEEVLAGLGTVQAFTAENWEAERYRSRLSRLLKIRIRLARDSGVFVGVVQCVGFSTFALILWLGGRRVVDASLSPGDLTSFILYVFSIAGSVGSMGSLYGSFREMRGATARVLDILETDAPGPSLAECRDHKHIKGSIRFDRVSFSYPGSDAPVLRDVSFSVEVGEVVAIVGPSGAGKSTLMSLLQRFYKPNEGGITVDGYDVQELSTQTLRQNLAIVSQDIFLFSGSIRDNVAYGVDDPDEERIWHALDTSGAKSFVRHFSEGLGTVIGERGTKLSMGQRQRLAVSRALYRQAPILVLDEVTSSLDADAEEWMIQALAKLPEPRATTLVIAHRLATARRADRIIVLDGGKIVAQGTHSALIEQSPLYRRYWRLQSLDAPKEL